jgi:hypothetical protein
VLRTAPDGRACADCGYHRDGGFAVTTNAVTGTPRAVTMLAMPPGTSVPSWTLQTMATTDVTQCFHPGGGPPPEVSGPLDSEPLLVHAGGRLTWAPSIGCDCDAFDLHRGDIAGLAARVPASCLQARLDVNSALDAATPGVGNAWYYLVTCVVGATNGTAGNDSLGVPRDAPACP